MGSASDYLEKALLDHVLKVAPYAQPASLYVSLYTTSPGDDDSGVEVTGGSYARKQFTDWSAAVSRSATNNTDIEFVTATALWGTVVSVGLCDALSGGNLLFWDDITTPRIIDNGDVAVIEAGEFDVNLVPGGWSTVLAAAFIDHVLLVSPYTVPTNLYIALYTIAPTDVGGGTEVTGGSYARELENTWDAASGTLGTSQNTNTVTFTQATAGWGTVVAFGIHDHLTLDQLLIYANLDASRAVILGDTSRFPVGTLKATCD